jgi:hypothetical protein
LIIFFFFFFNFYINLIILISTINIYFDPLYKRVNDKLRESNPKRA